MILQFRQNLSSRMIETNLSGIIIPCYNGAAFLSVAVTSAIAQTYPAIEIILVDDGSTDESPAIAAQFPVRYLRQENLGLSAARNTGIRASRGAWLVFLDADDRLLPGGVAAGMLALESHPECAMTVGDHAFISADGSRLRKSQKGGPVPAPYEALLRSNFIEMISSVLFRKSIFDQVGIFSTKLRVAEDYDLYLRIARVQPVCCHSAIVAEYRLHNSNTSRNSALMLTTTLQVLKNQRQYLGNSAARNSAFRSGMRSWRRQYGRRLASELAGSDSFLTMLCLRSKMWTLAAWYPPGIALFLLLRLRPAALRRFFPARLAALPASSRSTPG